MGHLMQKSAVWMTKNFTTSNTYKECNLTSSNFDTKENNNNNQGRATKFY